MFKAGMGFMLAALLLLAAAPTHAQKGPWRELTLRIGDIRVRYLDAGAGARFLVFIPGWTMTAEVWREQIPYFAARDFHVIAFDPRSHGQTTKTEEGNTYQQHAADLHALLKSLKAEAPILVGWSAGVTTILEYVASPEAIAPEKIVLVDGSPAGFKEADYPGGATRQQMRAVVTGIEEDRAKWTEQFVRGMFRAPQGELRYRELAEASLKTTTGAMIALLFDLFTGDRRPALLRIQAPTLVVVPDGNRLLGEYIQSRIAGARLEVVADAGHALFLEKPQAFNQALEAFLASK